MPTGPALIAVIHQQKKEGQRPSRPMTAPAMSSIPGHRLSYNQTGADGKAGEKDVLRVGHNLGGKKELMSFTSLLKSSAPKGKEKAKPKMGSLGASPLTAPQTTSASFSPPGRSASLPRSPAAIHGQERSKRGLGTPTKNYPVPKYRNPLQLFRSPKKEEPSPNKNSSLDIPAFRLDDDIDMTVKIVNKKVKKPGFTPF